MAFRTLHLRTENNVQRHGNSVTSNVSLVSKGMKRNGNGNIKNMRCLKSSAEIQNARQQSRPQGCLSALEKPRFHTYARRSRTTAVRRKNVWQLDISTGAILAVCSCWRLIPINDVGTLCWKWRTTGGEARFSPSLLVRHRAITWFTVNVKCIAYRYTVSGHLGNNALHSSIRCRYSVAEWEPITSNSASTSETCSPRYRSHKAISHSLWLRFAIGEYGFV